MGGKNTLPKDGPRRRLVFMSCPSCPRGRCGGAGVGVLTSTLDGGCCQAYTSGCCRFCRVSAKVDATFTSSQRVKRGWVV